MARRSAMPAGALEGLVRGEQQAEPNAFFRQLLGVEDSGSRGFAAESRHEDEVTEAGMFTHVRDLALDTLDANATGEKSLLHMAASSALERRQQRKEESTESELIRSTKKRSDASMQLIRASIDLAFANAMNRVAENYQEAVAGNVSLVLEQARQRHSQAEDARLLIERGADEQEASAFLAAVIEERLAYNWLLQVEDWQAK